MSGGWTYGELCPRLHAAGWALDNLASLPDVSVAGACATATHGSGRRLGCLAAQIDEVEFRPDRTPASGDELQTEYFVPWEHAPAAIATVTALGTDIRPVLLLTEIRAVAADPLWLSPFCGRDSLAMHFSWRNDWEAVRAVLPLLEEALAPYGARPHWGNLFAYPREYLERIYGPSMQRFREAAGALDPRGRFRNDFLDRWVFDG